jgi:hypothetical protein
MCCGDHWPDSFPATSLHRAELNANGQGLGRRARSNARCSARLARSVRRPPLPATSRLIVETASPRSRPSCRKEWPSTRPRDISSRSSKLSDPGLRDRGTGAKPPFAATTPNTEAACLPSARPISLSVSQAFQRRQSSAFCSCNKPGRPVRAIVGPFRTSQIKDVALTS